MLDNVSWSVGQFWIFYCLFLDLLNSFKECWILFWYLDSSFWEFDLLKLNIKLCSDRSLIDFISGTNATLTAKVWHIYQGSTQRSLYYKVFLLWPVATQMIYSLCELWAILLNSGSSWTMGVAFNTFTPQLNQCLEGILLKFFSGLPMHSSSTLWILSHKF